MRKEVFFAILAGGIIGLAIAFGAWKLNAKLKKTIILTNPTETPFAPSSAPSSANGEFKIVLTKPTNLQVFNSTPTIISGITSPNAFVVVSGEDNDEIMNSSDSGIFSANVDLEPSDNQIVVSAFKGSGEETDSRLTLIYSSQFDQKSVNNSLPQAYIGTVTDISNSVIQIKNDSGDIQQIAGTQAATYVKLINNGSKTISAADLAIGDYLVGMGFKDGNNILSASRILVVDPIVKTARTAIFGTVTDDSGYNQFIMKNTKGENITVTPAAGIVIDGRNNFGQIVNGDKLIVVGTVKDNSIVARSIKEVR